MFKRSAMAWGMSSHLLQQIETFDPDWILVSEDPTYLLLAAAQEIESAADNVVVQSPATLPFGPEFHFSSDNAFVTMNETTSTDSHSHRSISLRTFGLVVEAMLCGIPVIASYVRGLAEAKPGVDERHTRRAHHQLDERRDRQALEDSVCPASGCEDVRDRVAADISTG
jgi:hypothetical protein